MKRKVVQIAGFTKVISLPSQWVKKNNINKGDELDVIEQNRSLIISTNKENRKAQKAVIDLSKIDEGIIWPILASIHKTGYNEIRINRLNSNVRKVIHDKIPSSLFGFEIIEQSSDSCLIKNIAEGTPANFKSLKRKLFMVTSSQAKQSLEFIRKKNRSEFEEIFSLEETNNKLSNFCQRLLNEEITDMKNRYEYFIVWLLENVGDGYRDICREISKEKDIKVSSDVLKAYEKVNEAFEEYHELFYKFSLPKIAHFHETCKANQKNINLLLKKKTGQDAVVLAHLLSINRTLYDFIAATIFLKAELDLGV